MTTKQCLRLPRLGSRVNAWLQYMVMLLLAMGVSGCCVLFPGSKSCVRPTPPGEPDLNVSLPVQNCRSETWGLPPEAIPLSPWECPTGQPGCRPPETNGLGIFVVEGSTYCFHQVNGRPRFCPEGFANIPASASEPRPYVRLMGRVPSTPGDLLGGYPVTGVLWNAETSGSGEPVRIHSIQAEGTRFTVNYCPMYSACNTATQVLQLREESLDLLRLRVTLPADDGGPEGAATFEMIVTPHLGASTRVRRYDLLYRETRGPWMHHCDPGGVSASDRDTTSFLPRLRINSVNAAVEPVPTWTTIGCESGAIVTCLDWGYAPWNPYTGDHDTLRGHLFGSCLQAKRAAYFVGRGDLTSYTRNGTRINKRDEFGLGRNANSQVEELRTLEALWSPQGAVCLNPENRRVPDIALPAGMRGVPHCASPPTWTLAGKLATGTFTPAPE